MRKRNRHGDPHAPADARWGKKLSALFLSAAMCMTMLPGVALADEPENVNVEEQAQQDVSENPSEPGIAEENAEIAPETPPEPENEEKSEQETEADPEEMLLSVQTASTEHPHTAGIQHPVCVDSSTCTNPKHSHEAINWTAWDNSTAMPSETGNYYLTTDVTLTKTWQPAAGTVLCLNGYSITRVNSENSDYVIRISSGSFTLTDCAATQGVITHAEGAYGSGVYAGSQAPFYMYGGTISGNTGYSCGGVYAFKFYLYGGTISGNYGGIKEDNTTNATGGGGVYVYSTFDMYGGTIENNVAKGAKGGGVRLDEYIQYFNMYGGTIRNNTAEYGGGVYFIKNSIRISENAAITDNTASIDGGGIYGKPQYHPSQANVYVSGAARIAGNKKAGSIQNVLLINNQTSSGSMYAKLYVAGPLTSGAYIGVTRTDGESVVAEGADTYSITQTDAGCFHSDNEEDKIVLNGNQITLEPDNNPVASINGQNYNSLQTAINKAQEMDGNPTITLLRDATPYALNVTSGEFTIDLAGHKLAFTTNDAAITVKGENAANPVNLTIKDSTGTGLITSSSSVLNVRENATLTIESGNYSSQTNTPVTALYGTVVVTGGLFTGETGISVYRGNLTIRGGTFTGTKYGVRNTGVYDPDGTITIENGIFNGEEKSLYFQTSHGEQKLSGGTYPNGMQIITNGKLSDLLKSPAYMFKTNDGQVLSDDAANQSSYTGYLTVGEKAIASMTITEDQNLTYGAVPPTITVTTLTADNIEAEANYKWSLTKTVPAEGTSVTETLINTTKEYTVPSDLTPGIYKYTVEASASDGSKATASCTVKVNRRTIQIDGLHLKNKVYDGTTTAEIDYNGDTPTLISYDNKDRIGVLEKDKDNVTVILGTGEYKTPEVGLYKLGVYTGFALEGEAAENYELKISTPSVTLSQNTIYRRLLTPDFSDITVTKTYDGTAASGTVSGSIGFGADERIGSDNITLTATAGSYADENVGENKSVQLTVVLGGEDKDNYTLEERDDWWGTYKKQFTFDRANITKADGSVTAPTAVSNLVYNGEMQTLINEGASATGEVQYKLGADGSYSTDLPKAEKAGTYTVYYKVVGDKNHNDVAENSISVTIGKKPITAPAADDTEYTYNGAEQTYKLAESDAYTIAGNKQTDANEKGYTVTVSLTDKENTEWSDKTTADKTYSFVIHKKPITAPVADDTEYTYNGAAQIYKLAEDTAYTIIGATQTNANEKGYVVKALLTDKENTVWADTEDAADKTYSFVIKKAAALVTAKNQSAYVGAAVPVLGEDSYTVSGLFGEDKLTTAPTLKYVDADGKEIAPDMTKTGEAIIRASGAEDSNYVITYADGKLTVTTRPSSGGGGSSSTKTETTTNPDGSTTKTETKSDGTVTSTTTNKDGSTTKTETKKDGSSTTEVKDTSGSTGKVSTDKSGKTTASATISEKAVDTAKKSDEAVKVPTEVKVGESSASASTVKIDLPTNAGETKVEIPVKDVTSGTVAIIVKPDGTEEIVKNSVPTENGLELTVNGDVTVKIVDNAKNFEDTKGHWAQDAIDFVSARGLVNGTSDNSFSPEAPTTRAQLWTMLARKSDADLTGGANWYEKAQNWAKNSGISDGTNPNGTITRAEMVTMLWREAGSPVVNYAMNMADIPADAYYTEAVRWALSTGITTGVGEGRFDPNSTCTRAQIATFLSRSYLGK